MVFNGFPMLFHISRSEITVILCLLEKFLWIVMEIQNILFSKSTILNQSSGPAKTSPELGLRSKLRPDWAKSPCKNVKLSQKYKIQNPACQTKLPDSMVFNLD